jgi:hypothetical protein
VPTPGQDHSHTVARAGPWSESRERAAAGLERRVQERTCQAASSADRNACSIDRARDHALGTSFPGRPPLPDPAHAHRRRYRPPGFGLAAAETRSHRSPDEGLDTVAVEQASLGGRTYGPVQPGVPVAVLLPLHERDEPIDRRPVPTSARLALVVYIEPSPEGELIP